MRPGAGAAAALATALAALTVPSATAEIVAARYADPTGRYDHGILGDAVEYGALVLTLDTGRRLRLVLPPSRVFEDIAPRLADLDGDGAAEVIAVETDLDRGARLAILDESGLVAATPFIGRRHRWLAPVGAADLDGDGRVEIAYVDRPHLARILRIWRLRDGRLEELAARPGLTNHRIGEDRIAGGIRDCGAGPEIILASADWSRLLAVRFDGRAIALRDLAPWSAQAEGAALACRTP
ncbi:FG-GAP repeat domain-containing protein [Albidovulum sp.]